MRLRKVLLIAFIGSAVSAGAASMAYACTALATLSLPEAGYAPGATVSGTGKGFNGGGHGTPAGSTPVELRWNTRSGELLATTAPLDSAGNITFSFTAPNVPAGSYVLIAVQTNPANGNPFYGTPARQSVRIVPAAGRTAAERSSAAAPAAASEQQAVTASAAAVDPLTAPAGRPAASVTAGAQPRAAAGQAPAAPVAPLLAEGADQAAASASLPPAADTGTSAVSSVSAAVAADAMAGSVDPASVTTTTPGLVSPISSSSSSVVPAALLIFLGLGIGLVASARWVTDRLPQRRSGSAATA